MKVRLKVLRPLAVVTGASSGIGYHLACIAAGQGYDLVLAADTPLDHVHKDVVALGAQADCVQCDLSSTEGVRKLLKVIGERQVDALMANAGHGQGGAFLDQGFDQILHVINTNITGTVYLVHEVAAAMRQRKRGVGHGRILITGSLSGLQPGSYHAIYNASKAFVDSFAIALRNELHSSGTDITVTCLMPGPTDTGFYERADLMDTRLADVHKADPARVARIGFDAMMQGAAEAVAGLSNRAQAVMSKVLSAPAMAEMHRRLAEPGTAKAAKAAKKAKS